MFRNTRTRWAALTSGALVAGGLVVAPAVAGLGAASAAPVVLNYTCTVVGGGQTVPQDSTISIDLTVPAEAGAGSKVPASIDVVVDMGSAQFGPIQSLAGSFTIPLTVGGTTTNFTLPASSAPVSALRFAGTATGDLTAPAALGSAPVTLGNPTATLKTTPFGVDTATTCLPDAGQDQTVGALEVVEGGDPDPVALPVTGTVSITGKAKVGKTVKAVPGSADGATVTYQWLANGKAVKGATKPSMKLTKALKGKKVAVRATYAKDGYLDTVQTSKAVTVKK